MPDVFTTPVPAAQYVRMSTEHQQYSIESQAVAIAAYAVLRGFSIVRTYADEARSGLTIAGRPALRQLIADISSGNTGFGAVLVYDVSRWGRFQDTDESAYYEFLCRQLGFAVHYCAEPFENDGSPISTLIKAMKRVMAAEYSRELSIKSFNGLRRVVERGFRCGGGAPFGYRRLIVSRDGKVKGELAQGERKSVQTDRVVLVPGRRAEVALVRRMFRMYAYEGYADRTIANQLNAEGRMNAYGRPWVHCSVRFLLSNEAYIGSSIFNRRSVKLGTPCVRNPPNEWVRVENAFKAIVTRKLFDDAQAVRRKRLAIHRASNDELLEMLASFRARHGGRLTQEMINADPEMPRSMTYLKRFGSLQTAYEAIGFKPCTNLTYLGRRSARRRLQHDLIKEVRDRLEAEYAEVSSGPVFGSLWVDRTLLVYVTVLRCRSMTWGSWQWSLFVPELAASGICYAVQADESGAQVQAAYIFERPRAGMRTSRYCKEPNALALETGQVAGVQSLMALVRQRMGGESVQTTMWDSGLI